MKGKSSDLSTLFATTLREDAQGVNSHPLGASAPVVGRQSFEQWGPTFERPRVLEQGHLSVLVFAYRPPQEPPVQRFTVVRTRLSYGTQQYLIVALENELRQALHLRFFLNSPAQSMEWRRCFAKLLLGLGLTKIADTVEMHGRSILLRVWAPQSIQSLAGLSDVLSMAPTGVASK